MKANTGQSETKTTKELIDALNGDGRATLAGVRAFTRPEAPDSVVVAYRAALYYVCSWVPLSLRRND